MEDFESMDLDHSGSICREEWIRFHGTPEEFESMDLNHNGSISREEWLKFQTTVTEL